MPNIGVTEGLVLLGIVLLLFGAKRLPEIGGSLGKGIREFKTSVKEVKSDVRAELEDSAEETTRTSESAQQSEPVRDERDHS
jgi:sec-independent protein translocase protein TatA